MSNPINMRTFGLKMIAGAAIAGCALLSQAQSASALSLNFSPAGTSLDSPITDPVKDIATNVGDIVKFTLSMETFGIGDDDSLSRANYTYAWDNSELEFFKFTSLVGGTAPSSTLTLGPLSTNTVNQTFSPFIGRNLNTAIAEVSFTVLKGLNNDKFADFTTVFLSARNQSGTMFSSVTGTQTQFVEVQPVPTPALLPGIAAVGLGLLRKRQAKTATA
jgi:hypothetical protein